MEIAGSILRKKKRDGAIRKPILQRDSKYPWLFEASSGEYLTKILSTFCRDDTGLHPGQNFFFVSGVSVGMFTIEPGKAKGRGIKSEEVDGRRGQVHGVFISGNSCVAQDFLVVDIHALHPSVGWGWSKFNGLIK